MTNSKYMLYNFNTTEKIIRKEFSMNNNPLLYNQDKNQQHEKEMLLSLKLSNGHPTTPTYQEYLQYKVK